MKTRTVDAVFIDRALMTRSDLTGFLFITHHSSLITF